MVMRTISRSFAKKEWLGGEGSFRFTFFAKLVSFMYYSQVCDGLEKMPYRKQDCLIIQPLIFTVTKAASFSHLFFTFIFFFFSSRSINERQPEIRRLDESSLVLRLSLSSYVLEQKRKVYQLKEDDTMAKVSP